MKSKVRGIVTAFRAQRRGALLFLILTTCTTSQRIAWFSIRPNWIQTLFSLLENALCTWHSGEQFGPLESFVSLWNIGIFSSSDDSSLWIMPWCSNLEWRTWWQSVQLSQGWKEPVAFLLLKGAFQNGSVSHFSTAVHATLKKDYNTTFHCKLCTSGT